MPRPPKARPPEPIVKTTPARPQMADVARVAGVTISTVSRALSGSPLVNEETRAHILQVAAALKYSVNAAGRNLRSGQSQTIAVVIPIDATSRAPISDPFFMSLLGGIAEALTEAGFDMLLSRVDSAQVDQAAQLWEAGRAKGIILIGHWRRHDQLNQLAERGFPLVVWGAQSPHDKYVAVGSDNLLGGALATGHLLDQGARRVAFFGNTESLEFRLRHQGYLNAHAERGLMIDPALTRLAVFVMDDLQQHVEAMLANKIVFDAIFAASDVAAMTIIAALLRAGVQVPQNVLVAGYDDIGPAAYTHPALTTVRQPMLDAGTALVRSLTDQIEGKAVSSVILKTELIVRESTKAR